MPNYVSKIKMPNNSEYVFKSEDDYIVYYDNTTLYEDADFQTALTYDNFMAVVGNGAKKKLFVVIASGSMVNAEYVIESDDNSVTIIVTNFGENEVLVFSSDETEQTFSLTRSPVLPEAGTQFNFVKQVQGGSETDFFMITCDPAGFFDKYVKEMIAGGQTDEVWVQIIATFTGSMGEPGIGFGIFRYSEFSESGESVLTNGVYAQVSANSSLSVTAPDYQPALSGLSLFSSPFELNGQMKYAVINKAQTQTSTDYIDLDIQILDYSAGGGVVELPTTYDSQTEEYSITTTKTLQDLYNDFNSGKSIYISFNNMVGSVMKVQMINTDVDVSSEPNIVNAFISDVLPFFNVINSSCFLQVSDDGNGYPYLQVLLSQSDYAVSSGSSSTSRNIDSKVWYGTCSTAAATVAKTVTCSNFILATGSTIFVNFTYTNSATNPTLNVNNTGAKGIRVSNGRSSVVQPSTLMPGIIRAGANIFTYDGSYWVLLETTDKEVRQVNASDNSQHQLLFSSTTGTGTSTAWGEASKSANLMFNPSTSTLTVGNGSTTGSINTRYIGGVGIGDSLVLEDSGATSSITLRQDEIYLTTDYINVTLEAQDFSAQFNNDASISYDATTSKLTIDSENGTDITSTDAVAISCDNFDLRDGYGHSIYADDSGLYIENSSTGVGGINISNQNSNVSLTLSSSASAYLQGDMLYLQDGYGDSITMDDQEFSIESTGYTIGISALGLTLNNQPIRPTITLYFGQAGLYKDAARTTLYTTGDYANDIMDKNPILMVDGGGDGSLYPATYYSKNGSSLGFARITCLVNEANTLYVVEANYSIGTETFSVTSSSINKLPTGGTTGQVLTKMSGSDYVVGWTTPSSGSTPTTGTTNPTTSTAGDIGQMYLNTTKEIMYVCTYATSGTYHWKPITFESAESQVG